MKLEDEMARDYGAERIQEEKVERERQRCESGDC